MALGSVVAMTACGGGSSDSGAQATPAPPAATLDSKFGLGGIVAAPDRSPPPPATVSAIAIQPDGKIVAAGSAGEPGSTFVKPMPAPALVRYNNDGTLDLSFGNAGTFAGPPLSIRRIVLQPDGKIVALCAQNTLIRVNVDGSLDVTFGAAATGIVELDVDTDTSINDLALQSGGRILLAGYRQHSIDVRGVSVEFLLMRLTANGALDPSFGQGAGAVTTAINEVARIQAVAVTAGGAIVAAGDSRRRETSNDNNVAMAQYDADGTLDTKFGVGGVATAPMGSLLVRVNAMTLQSDGRIVVAGTTGTLVDASFLHHFLMVRFLANGALDRDFGTGGMVNKSFDPKFDEASAVAMQSNGKIVAVGYAGAIGYPGSSSFLTARFDSSGVLDPGFGNAGSALLAVNGGSWGNALAIQPDGRIVAAGAAIISETDQRPEFALIRYLGDPVPGVAR
ncbi:MAG: hypothetical protein ABI831_13160 [Betaproteobacteria bacterium]